MRGPGACNPRGDSRRLRIEACARTLPGGVVESTPSAGDEATLGVLPASHDGHCCRAGHRRAPFMPKRAREPYATMRDELARYAAGPVFIGLCVPSTETTRPSASLRRQRRKLESCRAHAGLEPDSAPAVSAASCPTRRRGLYSAGGCPLLTAMPSPCLVYRRATVRGVTGGAV